MGQLPKFNTSKICLIFVVSYASQQMIKLCGLGQNVVLHCAHKCGHAKVCTMYVHLSRQKKKPTELMVMKGAEIACLSDHSLRFPSWVISLLNLAFLNSNSNFGSPSHEFFILTYILLII